MEKKNIYNNFKNKVAIVTGGSEGIGFAVARALTKKGVKVLIVSRNKKKLQLAKKKLSSKDAKIDFYVGDVSKKETASKVINKCNKLWGKADILINNAGGPPPGNLLNHKDVEWEKTLNTNLLSVVRFSRSVIPSMKKKKWGRIISISSTISKEPTPRMILSATSRAGVASFTKSLALEFAEFNITSNVISVGGVLTKRLEQLIIKQAKNKNQKFNDLFFNIKNSIPAKRFAKPDEIASYVLFLCSEESAYINGQNLIIDGGLTKGY